LIETVFIRITAPAGATPLTVNTPANEGGGLKIRNQGVIFRPFSSKTSGTRRKVTTAAWEIITNTTTPM